MTPALGRSRPASDVGVVLAFVDIAQLEIGLISIAPKLPGAPIDHRNGTVIANIIEVAGLKITPGSIAHHPRLTPVNDCQFFLRACLEGGERSARLQVRTRWCLPPHERPPIDRWPGCHSHGRCLWHMYHNYQHCCDEDQ